jgi:hypothetical protein
MGQTRHKLDWAQTIEEFDEVIPTCQPDAVVDKMGEYEEPGG